MHLYEHELSRQALRDLAKVSVANSVSIAQVSLLQWERSVLCGVKVLVHDGGPVSVVHGWVVDRW